MTENFHPADTNGDGEVSDAEQKMYMEFKRKELEDQDAQRDAMRKMTWFSSSRNATLSFRHILHIIIRIR